MTTVETTEHAREHVARLCAVRPDRRPGSAGNAAATAYVTDVLRHLDWAVHEQWFDVVDWSGEQGAVMAGRSRWPVSPSPYSLGVEAAGTLVVARTPADLTRDLRGCVLLMLDDLAREPLTPTGYPFYRNDQHAGILATLQQQRPLVVLAGTGKAPDVAGSLDPFPLIEDGAFAVATGNLRVEPARQLAARAGEQVHVRLPAHRWPATACNVVGTRGESHGRVLIVAHVDSKPGTPGAVDNASGVAVLLLVAELLSEAFQHAEPRTGVELLAVNGEDYYAASGEVAYLEQAAEHLDEIAVLVNVDGVGYRGGATGLSTYGVPDEAAAVLSALVDRHLTVVPGPSWYQSDHMVFVPRGVPAVAATSEPLDVVLAEVAHSPHDTPDKVDPGLLTDLADLLAALVTEGVPATTPPMAPLIKVQQPQTGPGHGRDAQSGAALEAGATTRPA